MLTRITVLSFVAAIISLCWAESSAAQTVMLPVFRNFSYNGAVMVPDGGRIQLGGVKRSAEGAVTRGTPMLGNIPGLNRGFKNRAIGRESSNGNLTTSAEIIILEEYEQEVMAEAARRQQARGGVNADVAKKAAFLSKNIGKRDKAKVPR